MPNEFHLFNSALPRICATLLLPSEHMRARHKMEIPDSADCIHQHSAIRATGLLANPVRSITAVIAKGGCLAAGSFEIPMKKSSAISDSGSLMTMTTTYMLVGRVTRC